MPQIAATAPVVDACEDDDPFAVPDALVGMFGQWCPDELDVDPDVERDVEPDVEPEADEDDVELPEEADPDEPVEGDVLAAVVVDVLAAVVARLPVEGCAEVAPAASMPMPRLKPAAPAIVAIATTGCLSFITCPFCLSR